MAKSRDWEELVYVWSEWRRKSGENIKDMYEQLVEITNEAAYHNSKPFESNSRIFVKK